MPSLFSTPIGALPTELLIEISALCSLNDPLAPLTLGAVCRRWREVVNHSPRIWQSIFLDDEARSVQGSHSQADLWIQRSVPLSIYISINLQSPDLLLSLLSPLLPFIDRWRSVCISGKRNEVIDVVEMGVTRKTLSCLEIYLQDDVPADSATFRNPWPDEFVMTVWLFELPSSTMLVPLRFTHVMIAEDPLSEVHVGPAAILDFLMACPELESFYFTGWQHNDPPPDAPIPTVSLTHLHSLTLRGTCLTRTILSCLYAPRLTHLHLAHLNVEFALLGEYHDEGDSEDEAHDFSQSPWSDHATGMGLRKLITHSNPPIKVLDMDFSDMRTKDFRYVFDRMPCLEEFYIVASDMSDTVINLFRPYKLSGLGDEYHARMPRLKRLGLYNCQRLSGDAIADALATRTNYSDVEESVAALEYVAVVNCDRFTQRHAYELSQCLGPRLHLV